MPFGFVRTCKPTITRTAARRCANKRQRGASLYFTRGGGDLASVRKFVTTVRRAAGGGRSGAAAAHQLGGQLRA
jgi:hypothetical protein